MQQSDSNGSSWCSKIHPSCRPSDLRVVQTAKVQELKLFPSVRSECGTNWKYPLQPVTPWGWNRILEFSAAWSTFENRDLYPLHLPFHYSLTPQLLLFCLGFLNYFTELLPGHHRWPPLHPMEQLLRPVLIQVLLLSLWFSCHSWEGQHLLLPSSSSSSSKASWGLPPPAQGFPSPLLGLLFHARPPALSAKPSPGRWGKKVPQRGE